MKQTLFILLVLLAPLQSLVALNSLQYTVMSIGEDSGIQTEEVRRLFEDKEGFLWIGTTDGLYKYDGYKAQMIVPQDETSRPLSISMVSCFAESAGHLLWIGTANGLICYHKIRGYSEYVNAFRNYDITSVVVDRENRLWIGTRSGLWCYDPVTKQARHYVYTHGKNSVEAVQHLLIDSKGYLWIACWERGLYRFDSRTSKFHAMPPVGNSNSPHYLLEDNRGYLWIGSWRDGLFYFDLKQQVTQIEYKQIATDATHPNGLKSSIIYALGQDMKEGYIWVGGRNGLSVLCDITDPHSFVNISEGGHLRKQSISGHDVNSIVMSPTMNSVWLGILGGGIDRIEFREHLFGSIELPAFQQQYGRLKINQLIPIGGNKLWISVPRKTILEVEMGRENYQFVHTKLGISSDKAGGIFCWKELSPGEFIYSTYEGNLFRVWFTSEGELKRVLEYPYRQMGIVAFAGSGNNVLFATSTKIGIIRANETMDFLQGAFPAQLSSNGMLSDLQIDSVGHIWVSTKDNGIYRMHLSDNKESLNEPLCYQLTPEVGTPNGINKLYFDSSNRLWVGSYDNGLYLFDATVQRFESTAKTLLIPYITNVYDIIEDRAGRLWLDTSKGIFSFNIRKDGEIGDVQSYDRADGLLDSYASSRTFALTNRGVLLFGTRKGVNYLAHQRPVSIRKPLRPMVTNIKIHNLDFATLDQEMRQRMTIETEDFQKKLQLQYNENNVSIEFAALKASRPKQLLYAYMLEGLDKDWVVTSAQNRVAIYSHLQPGRYRFKVKVSEDHLTWSEEQTLAEITIVPAWWDSGCAYLVYTICFIVMVVYSYRFFLYRNRLKQEVLIKEVEKRSVEEMSQVKLQFFTNISHELLTPLTIISNSIEGLKKKFKSDDPNFAVATANVERLLRLFEQILEFRKAETHNLKLKVCQADIADFVNNLSNKSFRPLAIQKNLHYSALASPQHIVGYFDEDKLSKILFNLISNAIKFTPSLGTIQLTLQWLSETNEAEFHVHDTGMGIEEDQLSHIFRRFYDGEYRKVKSSGHGIGLSLTKELVELHRGVISVESKLGVGTDFRFTLPLSQEQYTDDEIVLPDASIMDNDVREESMSQSVNLEENSVKQTLLLVEDNQDLLISMVYLLEESYRVKTAVDGKNALAILEEQEVDVILSDIVMPVMDGITLCKQLKGDVRYSHIPVVLLTALNTVEDRVKGYEAGADGYIGKPFNLNELLSKINSLLANKARFYDQIKQKDAVNENANSGNSLDEKFLRQVVLYIEENITDEELDMDALASAMCVSRSVLYRKIKSLSGDAPSNFVRHIRLNKASLLLLQNENLSIGDIAFQVGVPNTKYFSTLFKKEFGVTPTEYAALKK